MYSVQGQDRTVAVRGHRGTVQQLYGDTVIVEADPTVVKRKLAPVPDFIIVCKRTQMIVKGLLDQMANSIVV